jgi:hypothetical protein
MANRDVILSLSKDPLTSIFSHEGRGRLGNRVFSGGIEGDFPLCELALFIRSTQSVCGNLALRLLLFRTPDAFSSS